MSSEIKVSSTSTALRTGSEEVNIEKVGDELECSEAALKEIKAGDNAGTEGGGGHALELPDILQEIFVHLSKKDLLNCGLVNKTWYKESRSVMQEHRETVFVTDEISPCLDLYRLNEDLKELDYVPVNGLHIKILEREHVCIRPINFPGHLENILEKLKIKFLTIDWNAEISELWRHNQILDLSARMKCPAVQLIIKLLKKKPSQLKELRLFQLPLRARLFSVEDMEEGTVFLEKLEVLETTWRVDFEKANEHMLEYYRRSGFAPERPMIPDIIAVAPNLKELRKEIMSAEDVDSAVPEGLTHIVKSLHFSPTNTEEDENYRRFALRNPKLSSFRGSLRSRNHQERRVWATMKQLLVSSQNTLREFCIDSYVGSMLEPLRIPSLPNVEPVCQLVVDYGDNAKHVRDELFKVNFTRLLPKVTAVEIFDHERGIYDFFDFNDEFLHTEKADEGEEGTDSREENTERIKSVKLKTWHPEHLDEDTVDYVFNLFPHAHNFTVFDVRQVGAYEFIWEHGSHIKELTLNYNRTNAMHNIDAMFCGLRVEEIKLLQQQSDEFLQSLNIVPTSHSILNSHMEKLNIYLGNVCHENCNETFFLSKVTGYLFFKRMPKLEITLYHDGDPKCISHLAPFVKIQATPVVNET